MLRYQASMYSDSYDNGDADLYHTHLQPSTIASSNGLRAQQGRMVKRQPATSYKNISSTTCRLAPRRRYFVMDGQKSVNSNSSVISFPGPDYLKRVKESYENGKIIYIRRNIPGLKNSSIAPRMTSTMNNSIRSTTYHTTTTSAASNSKMISETSPNGQRYLFRLPKNDFNKFDENQPNGNMYVPAYEPLKVQYTTVPACMSMGGEYVYEEEVEEENIDFNNEGNDDLMPAELFNSSSPSLNASSPKCDSPDNGYLKSSGQLVQHSSLTTSSSSCSTPGLQNNQTFKMLPGKNRLQPTRFTCPQADCFWRGPNDLALRKHMQVHGPKQPVMYSGAKNGDAMKVQLVQPKPKGVKCSECDTFAYSRPLLLRHMHDAHGIEAPLIRRTFANREMLQTWLDSLRETHAVEFVVSSGSKKWGRGLQVHYLTCSRSGDQKERPNKKYVRPPRPSIKCGRNCMAYLKIKQNPTVSELQIEGCLHHSGHEIDHTRMMLEPNELSSIGCIIDAVGEGLDITGNVETLRGYLGNSGRFRLVSDRGVIDQMPIWFEQYNRAMSDYMSDGSQMIPNMYRGSGALTHSTNEVPSSFCSSGPLLPMKSSSSGSRIINLSGKNGISCDIKRELDYEFKKMPIRFNSNQNRMNNQAMHQKMFDNSMYDETKVKLEIDEEDALAAQNLLKDEYDEIKHEDIFDSPMIGGEESRLIEDDDILCGGEEASGITSSLGQILNTDLPDSFANGELCAVDDINTDFNCGMNDDEFNELLGFSDFNDRSINCS